MMDLGFPEIFAILLVLALIYGLVRFVLWAARGRTVSCPFCAERIKPAAIVCRFCSREIPSPSAMPSEHQT
jgi:hypothetical protein